MRTLFSRCSATLFTLLLLPQALLAADPVTVDAAWARATAPGASNGAAYFSVLSPTGDRLLSARGTVSARVELHTHSMRDGMMSMHAVPSVELPAGQAVEFKPGGLHVMLIGLKQPLVDGEQLSLQLQFEKAGPLTVTVPVRQQAAAMPGGHGH